MRKSIIIGLIIALVGLLAWLLLRGSPQGDAQTADNRTSKSLPRVMSSRSLSTGEKGAQASKSSGARSSQYVTDTGVVVTDRRSSGKPLNPDYRPTVPVQAPLSADNAKKVMGEMQAAFDSCFGSSGAKASSKQIRVNLKLDVVDGLALIRDVDILDRRVTSGRDELKQCLNEQIKDRSLDIESPNRTGYPIQLPLRTGEQN